MIVVGEEIKDASITLPRAIMGSVLLNASLTFVMIVTLCFTLGDTASILATTTGYPFIQVIFNATQSYAGTNVMVAIVAIMLAFCAVSEVASASRQIWSFSRDAGLPGHKWLSRVSQLAITVDILLILLGLTWLEHSSPSCRCYTCHQCSPVTHQHWFNCCSQCYYISRSYLNTHFILPDNWLHCLSKISRTSIASSSMVTRKMGVDHQHRISCLFDTTDLLPDMAARNPGHCCGNELVECDAGGCFELRYALLRYQRSSRIRRTCQLHET